MFSTRHAAPEILAWAYAKNPGPRTDHSRFVALRYGAPPQLIPHRKQILGIKSKFEEKSAAPSTISCPGPQKTALNNAQKE